jgi:hypothetical protein
MLVSKLIPMVVAGSITAHSGPAIKERISNLVGVKDSLVTKQRMQAIVKIARLDVVSGEEPQFKNQREFRKYVKRNVRITGASRADSSLDMWGKVLRGRVRGGKLIIVSAGPDKKFRTKDDVKIAENIYDY